MEWHIGINNLFIILICIKLFSVISTTAVAADVDILIPEVPCPNTFRYLHVDNEWIGVIELDNIQRGKIYSLVLNLAFDDYLKNNDFGKLELLYSHEKTLNHILFSNRVAYKVKFPFSSKHIPTVTKITLNDQTICQGKPEAYQPITIIQLDHTLSTSFRTYSKASVNSQIFQNTNNARYFNYPLARSLADVYIQQNPQFKMIESRAYLPALP